MGKEYAQKFLAKFSRLFRASGGWAQAAASLLAWCFDHILLVVNGSKHSPPPPFASEITDRRLPQYVRIKPWRMGELWDRYQIGAFHGSSSSSMRAGGLAQGLDPQTAQAAALSCGQEPGGTQEELFSLCSGGAC